MQAEPRPLNNSGGVVGGWWISANHGAWTPRNPGIINSSYLIEWRLPTERSRGRRLRLSGLGGIAACSLCRICFTSLSAQPKWPDRQNVSRPGIVIWLKWTWSNCMTSPVSVQISPPSALSLYTHPICCDHVRCMTRYQNTAEPFFYQPLKARRESTMCAFWIYYKLWKQSFLIYCFSFTKLHYKISFQRADTWCLS